MGRRRDARATDPLHRNTSAPVPPIYMRSLLQGELLRPPLCEGLGVGRFAKCDRISLASLGYWHLVTVLTLVRSAIFIAVLK